MNSNNTQLEKAIIEKDLVTFQQLLTQDTVNNLLFRFALKKDSYECAKFIVKSYPQYTKQKVYINLLKETVGYGTVHFAKWLMKEKSIYFSKKNKMIGAACLPRSILYCSLNEEQQQHKLEMVKWLLTFKAHHKEINDNNAHSKSLYNSLVAMNNELLPIIQLFLENVKSHKGFKNLWQDVLLNCGRYDKLHLLLDIENKNYFPIEESLWKKILLCSINSYQDELDVVNYILEKYPHFKMDIQNTLDHTDDQILWSRDKFYALESIGVNLYNSEQVFYKIMKYITLLKDDNGKIDYQLLDILDIMKEKIAYEPAILEKIIHLPIEKEFLDFFIKCNSYFQLDKKINEIPQQIGIAKRQKI